MAPDWRVRTTVKPVAISQQVQDAPRRQGWAGQQQGKPRSRTEQVVLAQQGPDARRASGARCSTVRAGRSREEFDPGRYKPKAAPFAIVRFKFLITVAVPLPSAAITRNSAARKSPDAPRPGPSVSFTSARNQSTDLVAGLAKAWALTTRSRSARFGGWQKKRSTPGC